MQHLTGAFDLSGSSSVSCLSRPCPVGQVLTLLGLLVPSSIIVLFHIQQLSIQSCALPLRCKVPTKSARSWASQLS